MRALVTGLSTYWGGRARAGARAALRRRGRRRRRHARPAHAARAHRVRAHRLVALDPRPHRARHPGRHDRAHPPRRRLHARDEPHAARDQRHRHDEPARGRGRAREPGAQGRAEELGPRVRREQGRSVLLPRGHVAHRARRPRPSSVRCSRSRRSSATSPTTTRTSTSACCASPTCSASTSTRRSRPRCAARSCPRSSASIPRLQFIHEDDVVDALMYAINNDIPGVYNVGADGVLPWSEVCAIVGKRRVALPFVFTNLAAEPARLLAALGPAARGDGAAALRPLDRQHALQARRASATATRPPRRSRRSRRRCGSRARSATPARRTATSARSRTSSATPPPSSGPD